MVFNTLTWCSWCSWWQYFLVYTELVGYAISMSRLILPLICLFLSVSVTAETVYKKTNPDGSVVFTDQKSTDSEEVKVREPTSFSPPRLPALTLPTKKLSPSFNYQVSINKPANNSTILNTSNVAVSVSVQPVLKSVYGHRIRYKLGIQSLTSDKASVTFKNVDRGTHSIYVSIIDSKDEVVSPVASVQFHMKRFFKRPAPPPKPKVP